MLLNYNECLFQWHSNYQIKKQIKKGALHQIEKGIYSNHKSVSYLEILNKKYPNAILTMDSAFYYHDLTDVIPEHYYIATDKHSISLRDKRIKQYYIPSSILNIGITTMNKSNTIIKLYDRERMLIELLRYKNKLPYDYYKEILGNYRNIIYELDIQRIQEYISLFPKSKMIAKTLETEVL